jgi:predicted nucleic acid-binding protein
MPDAPKPIYWDTSVFLDYFAGTQAWMPILDALLDEASRAGKIVIVTSTVAITEAAFVASERADKIIDPAVEVEMDALWNDRSVVQLVEFDQIIARVARSLLRRAIEINRHLKPMDAIHLATAVRSQVTDFHTTDTRLRHWGDLGFPVREPWTAAPRLGI